MTDPLRTLLTQKSLEDFYELLADEHVDAEMAKALSDDDLKELGLKFGQRKRFLSAMASDTAGNAPKTGRTPETGGGIPAERRHLTVVFCDLVGSTSLATRLDPEDLREVITKFIDTCVAKMEAHSGYLAYMQGDGLMIYFGYPSAHEDDPSRAIRGALATIAAVQGLKTIVKEGLNVRIGIATGRVVVGEMVGDSAATQDFVVGETPNLASRMQSLAEPGEIIVAEETQTLASADFDFKTRGKVSVKGFDKSQAIFSVSGEATGRSRFDARAASGVQPIVGRVDELDALASWWQSAKEGRGRTGLIQGPAGIGKSRLLRALTERVGQSTIDWQCAPHLSKRALHPLVGELERSAGIRLADNASVRQSKCAEFAERTAGLTSADTPILAELVGAPFEDAPEIDAPTRAKQTLNLFLRRVVGTAENAPVLIVLEDAHWADPTTIEFLDQLSNRINSLRALVLITFRPEFEESPTLAAHSEKISLHPLDPNAGLDLVNSISGHRQLPRALANRIIEKTDGVPLFLEELTKTIFDAVPDANLTAGDALETISIPSTLQDSLMSRLDRIGSSKEIAQLSAVIGREFTAEMVKAIAPAGVDVDRALAELVEAELLYAGGLQGDDYFVFHHALVQDAAYESMLKSRRVEVHLELANAMLQNHPAFGQQASETIARHCEVGGLVDDAIEQWTRAGNEAVARAANLAAVTYLRSALRLLESQEESKDRDAVELGLQMSLGAACMSTFGWGSESVERASVRAQSLAAALGDGETYFGATWILWTYYFLAGSMDKALSVAQSIRGMAEAGPSGIPTLAAAHALSYTHYSRGELREAWDAVEWGLQHFDLSLDREMLPLFQLGSGNALLSIASSILWLLGRTEESEAMRTRALETSLQLEHAPNRAHCLHLTGFSVMFAQDWQRLSTRAKEGLELSEAEDLYLWKSMGEMYLGVAQMGLGKIDRGLERLDASSSVVRSLGSLLTISQFDICAADLLLDAGRAKEALARLDAVPRSAVERGEKLLRSEFLRVRGEALIALDRYAEGQAEIEAAIKEAEARGAVPLLERAQEALQRAMSQTV